MTIAINGAPTPMAGPQEAEARVNQTDVASESSPAGRPTLKATVVPVKNEAVAAEGEPRQRSNTGKRALDKRLEEASHDPIVHVTIGRIEVRATPLATPSGAKQRKESPVMTLDEYLSRRQGAR